MATYKMYDRVKLVNGILVDDVVDVGGALYAPSVDIVWKYDGTVIGRHHGDLGDRYEDYNILGLHTLHPLSLYKRLRLRLLAWVYRYIGELS